MHGNTDRGELGDCGSDYRAVRAQSLPCGMRFPPSLKILLYHKGNGLGSIAAQATIQSLSANATTGAPSSTLADC
jgi:hypothetical protein